LKRRALALSAALAAFQLLSSAAPPTAAGEGARLSFERRVYSEVRDGKKVLYRPHEVNPGESLWKIVSRQGEVDPADYRRILDEFKRLNPSVRNPSRLSPGEKVNVPLVPPKRNPLGDDGKATAYRVKKGETLSGILSARGVRGRDRARHIEAILAINASVKDANRIYAGGTIFLPTDEYFRSPSAPVEAQPPLPAETAGAPAPQGLAAAEGSPAVPLDRNAAEVEAAEKDLAARPATALAPPPAPAAEAPAVGGAGERKGPEAPRPPAPRPAWRGLLADVTGALGEKWLDRGTLYLPAVTGKGEKTVSLADYPMVRFSSGNQAVLDFRGDLPPEVRTLLTDTWKTVRVVPVDREEDGARALERFLEASGYALVREGLSRPLLIGDAVEVRLPARWQLFRTREAVEQSDVILLKEVPERLSPGLESVLLYASRVGLRILPYALDRAGRDGFLVGLSGKGAAPVEAPPPVRVAGKGAAALDASLAALGIAAETLPSSAAAAPVRTFTVSGKKHAVDAALLPAERERLAKEGYALFAVERDENARSVFLRLLRAAGGSYEPRSSFRVAGGEADGYEVLLSGDYLSAGELAGSRGFTHLVLVKGTLHSATRALLSSLRVGVVEW
jgi:hypothetical protein